MNTRNIFMIATIAASLAAVNTDAAAVDSPSKTPEFDIPEIEIDTPRLKPEGLTTPGIYRSEPCLTIVIVPESVDPALEHRLGADTQMDNLVIKPHSRLVPYRPGR